MSSSGNDLVTRKASRRAGLRQNREASIEKYQKFAVDRSKEWKLPDGDPINTLCVLMARAIRAGINRPPRTFRQWIEDEIYIPDGKYKGERFRFDRQPVTALWVDAVDSGHWNEYVFTGPSQFSKTLMGFVFPMLWHTCEIGENYVLGVPFAEMASDKWLLDIMPVLQASPRLRKLLPVSGSGSAGGKVRDLITLAHGVVIKLMSAGSDDTGKAGFTGRVLGITEAARFSDNGEASVEADPLSQLRARQRMYKDHERTTYIEGTLTIEDELPHRLHEQSTQSKIMTPCPHCGEWVAPERADLLGWQDARNEKEAFDKAYWSCPACKQPHTETERHEAVRAAQLVHRGQSIDKKGKITGELPDTSRLYFRAAAYHNMFLDAGDIAKDEWLAKQIPEDSNERIAADRKLCQFVHCVPYHDPRFDEELDLSDSKRLGRQGNLQLGTIPEDTLWLTAAADVGKNVCWWSVMALCQDANGDFYRHIPAYGQVDVMSDRMSLKAAVKFALREIHEYFQKGFTVAGTGRQRLPDQEWYDCGWKPEYVHEFLKEINGDLELSDGEKKYTPWIGAYGRGQATIDKIRYRHPRKTNNTVRDVGKNGLWYLEKMVKRGTHAAFWDADSTKWEFQHALTLPQEDDEGQPLSGYVTLHAGTLKTHERIRKHWSNEQLKKLITPLGPRMRWVRTGHNHLLDTCAMCVRAADRIAHIATKNSLLALPRYADPNAKKKPAKKKRPKADWYTNAKERMAKKDTWYDERE